MGGSEEAEIKKKDEVSTVDKIQKPTKDEQGEYMVREAKKKLIRADPDPQQFEEPILCTGGMDPLECSNKVVKMPENPMTQIKKNVKKKKIAKKPELEEDGKKKKIAKNLEVVEDGKHSSKKWSRPSFGNEVVWR